MCVAKRAGLVSIVCACIAVRRKFLLRNVLPFFCSVAKTGSNASQNISLSLLESAVLTRDRIRSVRTLDVVG